MGYTIFDVLDKIIKVETRIKDIYIEVTKSYQVRRIEIVSRVLAKEKERHIQYYSNLKKESTSELNEDIPFDIYDKISFLINQFNKMILIEKFSSFEELLLYALKYEEMNKALLIDMQGRLLRKKEDNNTLAYKILSEIITERQKHINNINNFIKPKK